MNKLILSLATLALAFATTANARTTSSTSTERSYASSSSSSFLAGGSNENEFTTLLTRGALVSEKPCKDCDSGTTFDISASYLRYLKDGFQVGAEARLQSLSKYNSGIGKSVTAFDIAGVGAYNFESDLKNSIYLKAGIGFFAVVNNARDDYENKLGLFLGGGKRFALWNNISYTPELRLVKKGDIDMGFEVAVLNFSIIW